MVEVHKGSVRVWSDDINAAEDQALVFADVFSQYKLEGADDEDTIVVTAQTDDGDVVYYVKQFNIN